MARGFLGMLAFFVGSFFLTGASAQERPLVFVPGILGSVLSDPSGEVIWGDSGSLNKSNFSKLNLIPETGQAVELRPTDVLRDVPLVFGLIEIGVYSKLIDFLTGNRGIVDRLTGNEIFGTYEEGKNLFVFPYDWRRTNFASAKRLSDFIEKHVPTGGYDLVAHSMGGIVTRLMLDGRSPGGLCGDQNALGSLSADQRNQTCNVLYGTSASTSWPNDDFVGPHPAADRLHTYVEMAVPHLGSNNTIGTYLEGWGALSRVLTGGIRTIQEVLLAMPSPLELAPLYDGCCAAGTYGSAGNERITDRDALLNAERWATKILGFGVASCPYSHCDKRLRILAEGLYHRKVIDDVMKKKLPPSIRSNFAIVGRFVEGTRETHYLSYTATGNGDGITYRENSDGDGTVHRLSALPPEYPVTPVIVANQTGHQSIFEDDSVQQQIHGLILNPLDEPVKAVSGKLSSFRGTQIESVGLDIEPAIAFPGDQVSLNLKMASTAGQAFDSQNLEDVSLVVQINEYGQQGAALVSSVSYNDAKSFASTGNISLSGSLASPAEPGVYAVSVLHEQSQTVIEIGQLHVIGKE